MPQMAPISWLILFITFSSIFLIFNSMNYFSFLPPLPQSHKKSISQTPMNWKW
uniref:ATP synthase F0 subunit 8 n=1 Tax=Peltoperlopsis sagittata TaxID=2969800 RepID=UPI002176DE4F|nr:ATP synthase F0 subunit 8 [Peltoperlopsis sagittata]UUK29388.1 ATP synthase F0 subunit 8 [Peltoperlopsis sagittata]